MNSKSCGCSKNMTSRTMPRMPRTMATKPAYNSCRANNWSNDNSCRTNNWSNDNACGMNQDVKSRCSNSCPMAYERNNANYVDTNWAKKYERSCTRTYDEGYGMERRYRRCNKRCELTFGEEVDDLPIAMGYVPYQEWDCNVSNACQGLYDGTIFPELVKPFECTYCYEERRGR